jgi:hypothetical protein
MKIVTTIFLFILSTLVHGQFAIIRDKDGYCHVRSSARLGKNVIDTLENGHLVYCFEQKDNWVNIDYTKKNNKEANGQVYHDRLQFISDYQNIPFVSEGDNHVKYQNAGLKIVVTQQKFDRSRYRFSYYKDAKNQIERINGKQYWGTDGRMPKAEYKSIVIYAGQRKTVLAGSAFENLFEPSLYNMEVHYDKVHDILYIESMNSDGAGSYEVIWKIEKGKYKGRLIAYGF